MMKDLTTSLPLSEWDVLHAMAPSWDAVVGVLAIGIFCWLLLATMSSRKVKK